MEKELLPGYKARGGGVSAHVLEQFAFSFEPVIESKIKSSSYGLGKNFVTITLPEQSVCMVIRDGFDAYRLNHTGAEVRQRVIVRAVVEKLRPYKIMVGAIEVETPALMNTFARFADAAVFIFGEVATGDLWIFSNPITYLWLSLDCIPGRASCRLRQRR